MYNPAESQKLQYAGVLMRQVFLNVHRGYHRILLNHGLDQATLDAWSAKADDGMVFLVLELHLDVTFNPYVFCSQN